MESVSLIAISQQNALRRQMDIIAHNIANMSTPGFKAENLSFKEFLAKSPNGNGDTTSFVQEMGINADFSQGAMTHTGSEFDFGINGEGMFTIGAAAGNRYTRNGHFRLDGNGQIVNENGDPLLSQAGSPMVIPSSASKVTVLKNGNIYADKTLVGKIGLVQFKDPWALERETAGIFKIPANSTDSPEPVTKPNVYQGMLESSNVQSIIEMTKMMQVARAYESAQKTVDKEDDRLRQTIRRLAQMQ